jgi:SAM-dependent methyltransferase
MSAMPSTESDFDTLVGAAVAEPVSGWRFPFLDGRRIGDEPAWDYSAIARDLVRDASFVLDHGTGGGEVLAELGLPYELMVATESYAPNVPIAARALSPLGICVVQVAAGTFDTRGPDREHPDRRMPFADASFDLLLARHVAFNSAEMFRILRPGGHLLTQMGRVGDRRPGEVTLNDLFPGGVVNTWPAWSLTEHLAAAGFMIEDYREQLQRTHFRDIGALVYFLRTIPWAILDFTVAGYRGRLGEMHDHIRAHGSLVTAGTAILAFATKPN